MKPKTTQPNQTVCESYNMLTLSSTEGLDSPIQVVLGYGLTSYGSDVPVLEVCGVCSTPSLPLLQGPL